MRVRVRVRVCACVEGVDWSATVASLRDSNFSSFSASLVSRAFFVVSFLPFFANFLFRSVQLRHVVVFRHIE